MLRARRPYLHSLLLLVFLFGLLPVPLAGPVNAHVGTPEPTVPVSAPDPVEEPPVEVEPAPEPTLAPEPTATATIAPTETPAPTPTPEPTATTAPTEVVEPTSEPSPEPTPTPTQETGIVVPTETAIPTSTPGPAATPTIEPTETAQESGPRIAPAALIDLPALLNLIEIECEDPGTQPVGRGSTLELTCRLKATATLNLLLISLSAEVTALSGSDHVAIGMTGFPACPGALIEICSMSLTAGLFNNPIQFTVYVTPACHASASGETRVATVRAKLTARVLNTLDALTLTKDATASYTVTNIGTVAPTSSITSGDPIYLGTSRWNGSSYTKEKQADGELKLTVSLPTSACLAPGSAVVISASDMTSEHGVISSENMTVASITGESVTWGETIIPSAPLQDSQTIFTTNDNAPEGASSTELTIGLNLDPPNDAPPGTYTGEITVTSQPPATPGD